LGHPHRTGVRSGIRTHAHNVAGCAPGESSIRDSPTAPVRPILQESLVEEVEDDDEDQQEALTRLGQQI